MHCPKCNSETKEVSVNFNKKQNITERKRKCIKSNCQNIFSTIEKISKQRKTELRTYWLEFKIECYVEQLVTNIWKEIFNYLEKHKLVDRFLKEKKINIDNISSNKKGNIEVTFVGFEDKKKTIILRGLKALTIRQLLKDQNYWRAYSYIFQKEPTNEIKANELNQFAKSIIHPKYGIKSGKYGQEFFKRNKLIKKLSSNNPEIFFKHFLNKLH